MYVVDLRVVGSQEPPSQASAPTVWSPGVYGSGTSSRGRVDEQSVMGTGEPITSPSQ